MGPSLCDDPVHECASALSVENYLDLIALGLGRVNNASMDEKPLASLLGDFEGVVSWRKI